MKKIFLLINLIAISYISYAQNYFFKNYTLNGFPAYTHISSVIPQNGNYVCTSAVLDSGAVTHGWYQEVGINFSIMDSTGHQFVSKLYEDSLRKYVNEFNTLRQMPDGGFILGVFQSLDKNLQNYFFSLLLLL